MTPELRPCPWCPEGGKLSVQNYPELYHVHAVYCGKCGAWGPLAFDELLAIEAWNRRFEEKP